MICLHGTSATKTEPSFKVEIFEVPFTFSNGELLLFGLSLLFSMGLFLVPKKRIASYAESDAPQNFYYCYKNGFGAKSYTKGLYQVGQKLK